MKLSEHIDTKYDKVLCPCCGDGAMEINSALINIFEKLREYLNKNYKKTSLIITSGYRCKKHNDDLARRGYPASKNSQHLLGNAFDIKPLGSVSADELCDIAEILHDKKEILTGGLGLYDWGIHIDVGNYRRWDYR